MLRLVAVLAVVVGFSALAQAPSEHQQCLTKCGEALTTCMIPCTGSNPNEAAKPENRSKTMGCVKKCTDGQQPCMKACDGKKK